MKKGIGAKQQHGFNFEKQMIQKYGMTPSDKYTAEWDAYHFGVPVSIKTAKLGSDIEMADYFRNASKTTHFYLLVGFWSGKPHNIVETHLLFINVNDWNELFPEEFAEKFQQLLDGITNDASDNARWKQEIKALRKEWSSRTDNLIRPRFKRDQKTQKRVQCAINNKDFYNHFMKYCISTYRI